MLYVSQRPASTSSLLSPTLLVYLERDVGDLVNNVANWLCLLPPSPWLVATQRISSRAYTPVTGVCPGGFARVRTAGSPVDQTLSTSKSRVCSKLVDSKSSGRPGKTYSANVEAINVAPPSYVSVQLVDSSHRHYNERKKLSGRNLVQAC